MLISLSADCNKEAISVVESDEVTENQNLPAHLAWIAANPGYDTISYPDTYRDDLPAFKLSEARASIDTSTLNECERYLYRVTEGLNCWSNNGPWGRTVCT